MVTQPSMRRTLHRFLLAAALTAGVSTLAGCKQEVGEKCEINTDCTTGICNKDGRCSSTTNEPEQHLDAAATGDARSFPDTTEQPTTTDAAGPDQAGAEVSAAGDVPPAAPDVPSTTPDVAPDLLPDTAPKPDGSGN